jgi:hypothetical protein
MAEQECIQVLSYVRRNRSMTREQFYDHWENVHGPKVIPWIEKHGIRRYQQVSHLPSFPLTPYMLTICFQIHVAGSTLPGPAISGTPEATDFPSTPIEFDGIAMLTVPSLERFTDSYKDPYYVAVIEPDERRFIDKAGPGAGVVVSFQGRLIDMVHGGKGTLGEKHAEYREAFEEFEKKGKD